MTILVGLILLGLVLYVSTLAYALPAHSRSRLSELLAEPRADAWLAWLDRYEWELHTLTSLLRLTLSLGVLVNVWVWHVGDLRNTPDALTAITAAVTAIVLLAIFAIAIPHALSIHAGEAILARSLGVLVVLRVALWPIGRLFDAVEFIVRRLLGKEEVTAEAETERVEQDILDAVSEGEAAGAVDEGEKEMIESVLELAERAVSAIMTPRTDINAVATTASFDELRAMIRRSGHSRIPVYDGSVDHIIGVAYAKDMLQLNPGDAFDARQIMRAAPYVPETKTLDELLDEFRHKKVQIAIVLDEYGGTAGLVTLEDILEELVGEIDDEYDQLPPPAINRVDDDTLEVDARVPVSEINAELNVELPEEEDYETIGGFVFATLGKIPAAGEEFQYRSVHVRVIDAEPRKIKRLRLHALREAESVAEER